MICAAESLPSISWMRPSMKPWRSLAASYSAFSLRSPWARASAMALMTQGRSTVLRSLQLFAELLGAALGDGDGGHVLSAPESETAERCRSAVRWDENDQTSCRPVSRLRMASGLESGLYCLAAGRCRVCSSMYWPDMTACEVWSEKHTHTDPAGNGTVCCCGAFLVLQVGLHAVVQLQHQVVVLAAQRLGDAQRAQQAGLPARIGLGARQEALGHRLEGLADPPDARRALRIDIGEHAQDALAVVGARGKRIDVQPPVVGPPRLHTRLHLRRAVAGRRQPQGRRVVRQQAVDQLLRLRAKAPDHRRHGLLHAPRRPPRP